MNTGPDFERKTELWYLNVYLYIQVITIPKYKLHGKEWESDNSQNLITPVEEDDTNITAMSPRDISPVKTS